jgi:glycerol-3-phosphate dehydrogenase (NAD(P)+)
MAQGLTVVLGAGAWGTALAVILARAGRRVMLCVRRPEHLAAMRSAGMNVAYLPGVGIPENLELVGRWEDACAVAETVIVAIPSRFVREAVSPVASAIPRHATVVSATKGIEESRLELMTRVLAGLLGREEGLAVLSGPGFAPELARGKPAALLAAARDESVANKVQELLATHALRVYRSSDPAGVEICGAAKNVIAIAAGISDGLELGSSARAAVVTRGLAEMMRLAAAVGGRSETVAGLAGLGDLVLTCTGDLSRNRRLGLRVGRGEPVTPHLVPGQPVAEGLPNASALRMLARRLSVEMPIVEAVYRVLYEGRSAQAMVEELLSRTLKAEF